MSRGAARGTTNVPFLPNATATTETPTLPNKRTATPRNTCLLNARPHPSEGGRTTVGGANLKLKNLVLKKALLAAFPLHDYKELLELQEEWLK